MTDMMPTINGPIYVPGWDEMLQKHQTRALVLQVLVNFELRYIPATQQEILYEIKDKSNPPLSDSSVQTIRRHLEKLYQDGHITRRPRGRQRSKRGGPTAPWRSTYTRNENRMSDHLHKFEVIWKNVVDNSGYIEPITIPIQSSSRAEAIENSRKLFASPNDWSMISCKNLSSTEQ